MAFKIIFATDQSGGFGYENRLPWPRIKEDMKHFMNTTTNHVVIMGRNTYNSMPVLPNRASIVVSSTPIDSLVTVISYDFLVKEYLDLVESVVPLSDQEDIPESKPEKDHFIIGGAGLINLETIGLSDEVYHTEVLGEHTADTFISPAVLNHIKENFTAEVLEETENCIIRKYTRNV